MEDRYIYELTKLGEQVRRLRLLRGMTQVDLALKCNVDNGDISRIENGRKNIEFYTIVKLAEALAVHLNDLFPLETVPKK
jgi:transcriptional regulator with XRE-family HTH domain